MRHTVCHSILIWNKIVHKTTIRCNFNSAKTYCEALGMELLIPTPTFSISDVHGSFFLGLECVNGTAKDIYTKEPFSNTKIECDKEVIKLS